MLKRFLPIPVMAGLLLSACQSTLYSDLEPEEVTSRNVAPPGAAPGTCWGRDETPAVIETVTEQVLIQPAGDADDGPAVYKTKTQQQIIKPREDTWFETPCEADLTPEFTATVQRALKARGHYRGPITGRIDGRTRAAIRAYQRPQGLDSGTLSLAAARQMGLVAIAPLIPPQPDRPEVTTAALSADTSAADLAAAEAAAKAEAEAEARAQAERDAQEAEEKARIAREKAAEAERLAKAEAAAKAAEEARLHEIRQKAEAQKAKRARELEQALADERARKQRGLTSLPLSSETY